MLFLYFKLLLLDTSIYVKVKYILTHISHDALLITVNNEE